MTLWQRRTLGILTLGGGAVGITITLKALLAASSVVWWVILVAFLAIVSLQLAPMKLNAHAIIGSQFNFGLLQLKTPWQFGVNLFALGVCWWLARCIKAQLRRPLFPDRDVPATQELE